MRARPHRPGTRAIVLRTVLAAMLGAGAALLIACGSSGKGLIPSAQAGPLQADFEAVSSAAQNGNGSCSGTEAAIKKAEDDFNALPVTVDAGLRTRLREGITNLRSRALALCAQPLATPTSTGTTTKTTATSTQTATTNTATTPPATDTGTTEATPPPATATTPATPGGGTPAPGEDEGHGNGNGGGVGPGGQGPPGQEGK